MAKATRNLQSGTLRDTAGVVGVSVGTGGAVTVGPSGSTTEVAHLFNGSLEIKTFSTAAYTPKISSDSKALVNGQEYVLCSNESINAGLLLVMNISNATMAMFYLQADASGVIEVLDPSSTYSTTKDTTGINVYYASNQYRIQSKGATKNVAVLWVSGSNGCLNNFST